MSSPGLDVDGPAAPPRDNGELVFTAPWQPRVFGVTMTLVDAATLGWEEFRSELVVQVARERPAGADYWTCWADALEVVLSRRRLLDGADVATRAQALATRPSGHDHPH